MGVVVHIDEHSIGVAMQVYLLDARVIKKMKLVDMDCMMMRLDHMLHPFLGAMIRLWANA